MATNKASIYTTLGRPAHEIRLLLLQRGAGDEPICCQLSRGVDLHAYTYEALSYEWGRSTIHPNSIYINGVARKVRTNLYIALLHVRRSRYSRTLWIDDLCIDQDNKAEKEQQMQIMSGIYNRSLDTLAWLGPASPASDCAIQHIKWIGELDPERAEKLLNDESRPFDTEMAAIRELCNRPYWRRAWIVPEVCSASQTTLYCGTETVPWEIFATAGRYVTRAQNSKVAQIRDDIQVSLASKLADLHFRPEAERRLKDWLKATPTSICSKPRDRIFSLLPICTDCESQGLVDYRSSLSEVYKKVLRRCKADRETGQPAHDILELSSLMQGAMNSPLASVKLTPSDTEEVWICGVIQECYPNKNGTFSPGEDFEPQLQTRRTFPGHLPPFKAPVVDHAFDICAGKLLTMIGRESTLVGNPPSDFHCTSIIKVSVVLPMQQFYLKRRKRSRTASAESLAEKRPKDDSGTCAPVYQDESWRSALQQPLPEDAICKFPGSCVAVIFRKTIGSKASPNRARWSIVGTTMLDEPFEKPKEIKSFWNGNPEKTETVWFGDDSAVFLRVDMVTLQRLTADDPSVKRLRRVTDLKAGHSSVFQWEKKSSNGCREANLFCDSSARGKHDSARIFTNLLLHT